MKKVIFTLACSLSLLGFGLLPACGETNTPSSQDKANKPSGDNKQPDQNNNTDNTENTESSDNERDPDRTDDPADPGDGYSEPTVVDKPTCPNCGDYGTCDEKTLTCKCNSQFTGTRCDQCNERFAGPYCEECAEPTIFKGPACNICVNEGKTGSYCERCREGYYGPDCQKCNCLPNTFCRDGILGDGTCTGCPANLDSSKKDGNCDICAKGYYGPNCEPCNCDAIGGVCHDGLDGDGACVCNDGFIGAKCDSCALGHFGNSCSKCGCKNGTCQEGRTGSGACDCPPNYYGPFCGQKCSCNTTNGICNDGVKGDGTCTECKADANGNVHWALPYCTRCTDNWAGNNCDDCDDQFYGPNCQPCTFTGGQLCTNPSNSLDLRRNCDYGIEGSGWCVCGDGKYTGSGCYECDRNNKDYNAAGCYTSHGSDLHDITYHVITIKTEPALNWMAENIKYNGEKMGAKGWIYYPHKRTITAKEYEEWVKTAEAQEMAQKYGYLFSWEDAKKVCPPGWRLPTEKEINDFADYMFSNKNTAADLKTKEAGFWVYNNVDAPGNDYYGFNAKAGGMMKLENADNNDPTSIWLGESAVFWGGQSSKWSTGAYVMEINNRGVSTWTEQIREGKMHSVRCVQK